MLKKGLIVGAGLLLLAGLFCAPFTRSHIKTLWGQGSEMIGEIQSVEYQLDRAKALLDDIPGQIRQSEHVVAKASVEVDQLREDLNRNKEQLAKKKSDIMRLKDHYDSGETYFIVSDRSFDRKQVHRDLTNRFAKFQTQEATVDKLEKILMAREKALKAAQDKLDEMRNAKSQIEVEIANLEARLELIRVAETASEINFDNSTLSQTKELLQQIKSRIDVQEKVLNTDTEFDGLIPLDEPADEEDINISDEIADYFGDGRADIEALAAETFSNN